MTENLVQHRGEPTVWERRAGIPDGARWLAAAAAIVCFVSGLKRRSAAGLLLAAGAGVLGWWGITGSDRSGAPRVVLRPARWRQQKRDQEMIDEASEESFPASDAPTWNKAPEI